MLIIQRRTCHLPNSSLIIAGRIPLTQIHVHFYTSFIPISAMAPQTSKTNQAAAKKAGPDRDSAGAHAHNDESTEGEHNDWKKREPYKINEDKDDFEVKWKGSCHCGKVKYQLSREKPLASKYCHCTTCQRLHGVRDCLLAPTTRKPGLTSYLR